MNQLILRPHECALLVVDIQERLVAAMPTPRIERLTSKASALIAGARLLGVPVLATEQYPKGLGSTIEPIREALGDAQPVEKTVFCCGQVSEVGAFFDALPTHNIIVIGMETHICVWQTVRALCEDGRRVWVAADCVASRSEEDRAVGLALCEAAGAQLGSAESILFDWIGGADHEHFRAISRLVR